MIHFIVPNPSQKSAGKMVKANTWIFVLYSYKSVLFLFRFLRDMFLTIRKGILFRQDGILYVQNGVLLQQDGILHGRNGVLLQQDGILHVRNGFLLQQEIVLINLDTMYISAIYHK